MEISCAATTSLARSAWLIQELKNLVEFGILYRKAYPEIPPRVEYSLTEHGKKALPIIDHIAAFGAELIQK